MKVKMIQIFADWPMSHAKRVTKNYRKNPEYHVAATIRRLRTDKNCPAERNHGQHMLKMPEQHMLSTVAILGFQFGLYQVVVPLNFLRSIRLASLFFSLNI